MPDIAPATCMLAGTVCKNAIVTVDSGVHVLKPVLFVMAGCTERLMCAFAKDRGRA